MDFYNLIIKVAIYAIPVIFAITLHEAAHGYVAKHFGDTTAYMLGRVTLNPVKHIDPVGTVAVPLVTLALAGFMFGWAKPVPVNENNLRKPRPHMALVAAAGPGANIFMMLLWAILAKVLLLLPEGQVSTYWVAVAEAGIVVNVVFAVLNLFPLLPLDGGRIVASLLPPRVAYIWSRTEPFGMIVLILLLVTGVFGRIMSPVVSALLTRIYSAMGLS